MRVNKISAAVFGLAMALSGAQAQAQDVANNTAFGDWIVNCEAVTVSQTACRLVQVLSNSADDSLVVRLIALPGAEDTVVMLAQVPMGVYLPGGVVFRPEGTEDAEQSEMVWQRCLGQLCEAAIALTPDYLDAFTQSGAILLGYRMTLEGQPLIVRVDVSRFAEAVDAIRASQGG